MASCPGYLSKLGDRYRVSLGRPEASSQESGKVLVTLEDMNGYEPSALYLRRFL